MFKFLLSFTSACSILLADISTKDIRSPSGVVFDITKNTDYALSVPEIYSEKIPTEISPIWGYRLRANKIDTCKTDSHSATYCPLEMAVCASQWDYKASTATAINKTYTTSPAGCAGIQVGGVCYTQAGNICSSGSYNSTTNSCSTTVSSTVASTKSWDCYGYIDATGNDVCNGKGWTYHVSPGQSSYTGAGHPHGDCGWAGDTSGVPTNQTYNAGNGNRFVFGAGCVATFDGLGDNTITIAPGAQSGWGAFNSQPIVNQSTVVESCSNGATPQGGQCTVSSVVNSPISCALGQVAGISIGGDASKCYSATSVCGQATYTPPYYQCITGTLSGAVCNITSSYQASNTLSTYAATASTGFGWDNCEGGVRSYSSAASYCSSLGKRLPTFNETSMMGGPVPSCLQVGGVKSNYTWTSTVDYREEGYTYLYTWSGSSSTSGYFSSASNSTARTRCVGNQTTYVCPSGGTLSGTTCTVGSITCPSGGILSGTTCTVSSTAPATFIPSSCQVDYKYYSYQCASEPNQFGKDYSVINPGGIDCGGANLVDTNGDGIGDSCTAINNTSNCKREKFACVANAARPCAEIAGQFKCSPFACDTDKKCGYAHCPTEFGATNGTETSPLSADPLKYVIQPTTCTGSMCDLVQGPRYTMCGKKSCPAGFGVYEKGGKCYKDTCKSPSVEVDGKCVTKN